jgi:hypothetical protein
MYHCSEALKKKHKYNYFIKRSSYLADSYMTFPGVVKKLESKKSTLKAVSICTSDVYHTNSGNMCIISALPFHLSESSANARNCSAIASGISES